jgi:hypothetical protein
MGGYHNTSLITGALGNFKGTCRALRIINSGIEEYA